MAQRTLSSFFKPPVKSEKKPRDGKENQDEGNQTKDPSNEPKSETKENLKPLEPVDAKKGQVHGFFAAKPKPDTNQSQKKGQEVTSSPNGNKRTRPDDSEKESTSTSRECKEDKSNAKADEETTPKKAKVANDNKEEDEKEAERKEEDKKEEDKKEEERKEEDEKEEPSATSAQDMDEDEDEDDEGSENEAAEESGKGPKKVLLKWDNGKDSKEGTTKLASLARASKYDPVKNATFKPKAAVPYLFLCKAFELVSQTSSRLEVTVALANCLRSILALTPEDLLPAIYLCVNHIAPDHEGIELGVGDSLLVKAIADASGKTEKQVKALYVDEGDLGIVAQNSKTTQKTLMKPQPLTVRTVFNTLKEIGLASGKDSGKKRSEKIRKMMVASTDTEPVFLVRSLQGKMRIGLAEQTVLASLALALVMTPPGGLDADPDVTKSVDRLQAAINDATDRLKMVYSEVPSYDVIIPILIKKGLKGLSDPTCSITCGLPVKPMLAKPTRGIQEVLDRFTGQEFTCEYKYDGERAQIHYNSSKKPGQQVTIFSRNSENHTTKYPDIIERIPEVINEGVTSFILDSEVVAYDTEEQKIKPFQVLQHRGRKNIQLADVKIQVILFGFDLLYLNGKSLLREPLFNRRENLYKTFKEVPAKFQFATARDSNDLEEIQDFLNESIKGSCEGLMVKTLKMDATYQPSKRSLNWLKVKKDYIQGVGDSLDLVPIGGYIGKGKRTGWYGGFLLACYCTESEELQSVCKIGTGFSEENLAKFATEFQEHTIPAPKPYYRFCEDHRPDVWFNDHFVWEVLAADLTISPAHKAAMGIVDPEKGIALRFPRFIRVREDKAVTEATDATQVAEMYQKQFQNE